MPQLTTTKAVLSRPEAIDSLRQELLRRAGNDDVSACTVAAEQGILCHGFAKYTDRELSRRYEWIARRRPKLTRAELEDIADRWQLARQDVEGMPLACDVQQKVHDTCHGWDDFSNEDLSRFTFEMTGRDVIVE